MHRLKTIEWVNDAVRIVDQTKLPVELAYRDIVSIGQMYEAIKTLQVRGAPAIGVAAAYGIYLGIRNYNRETTGHEFFALLDKCASYLIESRPTAVNLQWAVRRMIARAKSEDPTQPFHIIKKKLYDEAHAIRAEDIRACKAIGNYGFELLKDCHTLLTHCNAGGLATVEYGTALAPVYVGKERGKIFQMYADETRPLLQGSRITAFELMNAGIPVTIMCDSMAATVMAQGKIDAVIVGADRIAANGDTANKIGTYSLALCASAHKIPFYVAAPASTFDLSLTTGKDIPIELRGNEEIIDFFGKRTGPIGVSVYNPAFDVTPNVLISALITEKGVAFPPFTQSIATLLS